MRKMEGLLVVWSLGFFNHPKESPRSWNRVKGLGSHCLCLHSRVFHGRFANDPLFTVFQQTKCLILGYKRDLAHALGVPFPIWRLWFRLLEAQLKAFAVASTAPYTPVLVNAGCFCLCGLWLSTYFAAWKMVFQRSLPYSHLIIRTMSNSLPRDSNIP